MPRLFGTDGVRGKANEKLTPELALRIGQAAGILLGNSHGTVLVGKDPRRSSYMLEYALAARFTSAGLDVLLTGPIPTPGVAMLTSSMRADLGVMISASHNLFEDNGIKIFDSEGFKLSDEKEDEIERLVDSDMSGKVARGAAIGRIKRIDGAHGRYVEAAKRTISKNVEFKGWRVVIDCANGAAYEVAPQVLRELGAEVVAIGVTPDGTNINNGVGSTSPQALISKVNEVRANIGIALDGDADRVVIVDENGGELNGDHILAAIATSWSRAGRLNNSIVVGTIMTNLGLETYLSTLGVTLVRAAVGDRYVLEEMRKSGANLGGEQSGHVIMSDYSTTGDGLVSALQMIQVAMESNKSISQVGHLFRAVPQIQRSVKYHGRSPLEREEVKAALERAKLYLGESGLVVRLSGTEPVVRVMAQGDDEGLVREVVDDIVSAIES